MKKIVFSLILCLGLIGTLCPSYAADDILKENAKNKKAEAKALKAQTRAANKAKKARIRELKKTYRKNTKEINIIYALELMKDSPASGAYEKIMGNNPTLNPMKIEYKNLAAIKPEYRNNNAMSKIKRKEIKILLNSKHKNAPYEAQSAALAGMTAHVDKKESVNELVYSKTLEAFLWNYYLKKNPNLKQNKSSLVVSENRNLRLYKKYPRNSKEIVTNIRKQRNDIKYVWESTGYTHKEYTDKMAKIYEAYLAVEELPGVNQSGDVPVLDLKEDTTVETTEPQSEEEKYIQEHIRSDVKAKPMPEEHYEHQVSNTNKERCDICGCPIENIESNEEEAQ